MRPSALATDAAGYAGTSPRQHEWWATEGSPGKILPEPSLDAGETARPRGEGAAAPRHLARRVHIEQPVRGHGKRSQYRSVPPGYADRGQWQRVAACHPCSAQLQAHDETQQQPCRRNTHLRDPALVAIPLRVTGVKVDKRLSASLKQG